MAEERRALRLGVTLILLAAVWHLGAGGGIAALSAFFQKPEVASFLVYLETGRVVHLTAQAQAQPTETPSQPPPSPTPPAQEAQQAVRFSAEDGALLSLYDLCGQSVDLESLLLQPLTWDLTASAPAVLILHTHATESYTKTGQSYVETSAYRTLDTEYNMVKIGQRLAQRLEEMGISVIHDTTLHDYPSYNGSYNLSRKTAEKYLAEYPSIQLVLDIHRDATETTDGRQVAGTAFVDEKTSAQLMLVVGTDAGGLVHPKWRENMALATKLQVLLEKQWRGITRPICFRSERFNQDLLTGALLVEVGAAGNTLEEALVAADSLAWAIGQLKAGANQG